MSQIKPLFEGACIQCHNPEEDKKEGAEYEMTKKEANFICRESYGEDVIRPGDGNDSPVYWMTTIHLDDPDDPEAMPPKKPLNEYQQQIIKDWIDQGAEYEEHWSWAPIAAPAPPNGAQGADAIDAFVDARLAAAGLEPAPLADRRTLQGLRDDLRDLGAAKIAGVYRIPDAAAASARRQCRFSLGSTSLRAF